MSQDTIEHIIGATIVVALLGFAALFLYQGADTHVEGLIVAALGIAAYVVKSPRRSGPTKRRGPPPLPMLWIVAIASVVIAIPGCGAGMIGAQADLIALGGIASAGADEMIVDARAHELDAIVAEARATCGDDGCTEEQATTLRERLDAGERRWSPVLACRAPVVEALSAWLDGLETAHVAATADIGIALLVRLGLRFITAYSALARCVEAAAPDVDLPQLPPELVAIGGAL